MSAYENFVQDFPVRCNTLLEDNWISASINDLEVTLMLATAAAGFVIPYERLRSSSDDHFARDRVKSFATAIWKLENIRFKNWVKQNDWEYISEIDANIVKRDVEKWGGPNKRKPLSVEKTVGHVFNIVRNALAHGNIITYPRRVEEKNPPQIEKILFLSKIRDKETGQLLDKYNVVVVGPQGFALMLKKWFDELSNLEIPSAVDQIRDITELDTNRQLHRP